jgi:hypothetical protein
MTTCYWCHGCHRMTFADGHDIGALDNGPHTWPAFTFPVGWRESARKWTRSEALANRLWILGFVCERRRAGFPMQENSPVFLQDDIRIFRGPQGYPDRSIWGTPLTGLFAEKKSGIAWHLRQLYHRGAVPRRYVLACDGLAAGAEAWNWGVRLVRAWAYASGVFSILVAPSPATHGRMGVELVILGILLTITPSMSVPSMRR